MAELGFQFRRDWLQTHAFPTLSHCPSVMWLLARWLLVLHQAYKCFLPYPASEKDNKSLWTQSWRNASCLNHPLKLTVENEDDQNSPEQKKAHQPNHGLIRWPAAFPTSGERGLMGMVSGTQCQASHGIEGTNGLPLFLQGLSRSFSITGDGAFWSGCSMSSSFLVHLCWYRSVDKETLTFFLNISHSCNHKVQI